MHVDMFVCVTYMRACNCVCVSECVCMQACAQVALH